ncbi:MAG: DNA polymerase III subunit gamma/tau [Bacteroidetes bacterium]|nr:DNA polymerase III subunit gamma/tau [Bacteroidota bacterium]
MNNFIVSARKYRPDTFDTVVGQHNITHTLKNAIRNNHLAQAFLFTGPRGVGKTTTARLLAKTINCTNVSKQTEACNQCESCTSFNEGTSLNIFELDAASNNSVDDIRVLVEQVRYPPQGGRFKVYIIDEVHMLSTNAFNAFLKTLEEPPSYAIFILATTEKHKIIPTILSRCQIFDFSRITIDDIAKQLAMIASKENVEAEEDALHIIAQKADGAMRDALSMFDQQVSFAGNKLTYKSVIENLNVLDYDYYFKVTNEILNGNISEALLTFNEILNHGFDGHNFITGLSSHFRDLLVCQDVVTLKLLEVSANVKEKYKVQSKQAPALHFLELLDISNKCDMSYRAAKHQRLQVELALMKMCSLSATGDKKKSEPVIAVKIPVNPVAKQPVIAVEKPELAPPQKDIIGSVVKEQEPPGLNKEELKPAAPVAPKTGSSSRRTISITDGLKQKSAVADPAGAPESTMGEREFSAGELHLAWNDFAGTLQADGRFTLHTALTKRKPELNDNYNVHFSLDNGAVEKDVNEIKQELLTYIRKRLNNGKIALTTTIDRDLSKGKTPYTPKEKFEHMAVKNPALLHLKKQMDLEI